MHDTPRPEHVALHIGAHKTATTHLQNSLQAARHYLAGIGVQYYGPELLRGDGKTLANRFGIKRRRRDSDIACDVDSALRDLMWDGRRLVLSEENFIGVLLDDKGRMRQPLYPWAAHRISQLASKITRDGIHVHLAVRDPATFINSGFSQAIRSEKTVGIETYLINNPLSNVNWADLVERVSVAPGVSRVTVWRYEDYADLFGEICVGLVGAAGQRHVQYLTERAQVGLSAAAINSLTDRTPITFSKAAVISASKAFPIGPENPPFDAFDTADRMLSAEYYEEQIAQIEAIPKVTLLRPSEA